MLQATSFFWQYSPTCTPSIKSDALAYSILELFSCSEKPSEIWNKLSAFHEWPHVLIPPEKKHLGLSILLQSTIYIYIYLWTIFDHNDMYINILYRQQISEKHVVEDFSVSWWLMRVSGFQTPTPTNNCGILSIINALFKTPKHLEGVPWSSRNCHRF